MLKSTGSSMTTRALLRLEPCAGKLARTVLRGLGAGNCSWLLDYNAVVVVNKLTHVGCMAHARRKFREAVKAQDKKKPGGNPSLPHHRNRQ